MTLQCKFIIIGTFIIISLVVQCKCSYIIFESGMLIVVVRARLCEVMVGSYLYWDIFVVGIYLYWDVFMVGRY